MTQEQLEALMQYVRAVASREAVLAVDGHTEGGYDRAEQACEDKLRRLFLDAPVHGESGPNTELKDGHE